jgi:hypothetical protein
VVALAWIATLATLVAAPALAVETGSVAPFAWLLVGLLAGAGALGRALGQRFLVWPVAAALDLLVPLVVQLAIWGRGLVAPATAVAVALALFAISAGGALARAALDRGATTYLEMAQTTVAFLVAVIPARIIGGPPVGLGAALAGVALFAVARATFEGRTLAFWTWTGLALVLGPLASPLVDAVAAAALLVLARRRPGTSGELQAVAALVAAALASGLLGDAARGLLGVAAPPAPAALAVLALIAAAAIVGVRESARAAQIASLALLALCATGVAAGAAVGLGGAAPAIRTGVLTLAAVALAIAARWPRLRAAALLVHPMLVVTAAKIGLEDLRVGAPATLFASFALFGSALIIAPRLRPRARPVA